MSKRKIKVEKSPRKQVKHTQNRVIENIALSLQDDLPYLQIGDAKLALSKIKFDVPFGMDHRIVAVGLSPTFPSRECKLSYTCHSIPDRTVLYQVDLFSLMYANENILVKARYGIQAVSIGNKSVNRYSMCGPGNGFIPNDSACFYLDKLVKVGPIDCIVTYTGAVTPVNEFTTFLKDATSPYLNISAYTLIRRYGLINIPIFFILALNRKNIKSDFANDAILSIQASKTKMTKLLTIRDKDISVECNELVLKDPYTLKRIKNPIRFKKCKHLNCFDMGTLEAIVKPHGVVCTICNTPISKSVSINDFEFLVIRKRLLPKFLTQLYSISIMKLLVYDEYVEKILNSTKEDKVVIDHKGDWSELHKADFVDLNTYVPSPIKYKKDEIEILNMSFTSSRNQVIDLTNSPILSGMTGEVIDLVE